MEPIEDGFYYHIYNRGAGKNTIFWSAEDYNIFIRKYFYYLYISAETFAWCLLKNHFHLLIRVRTFDEQETIFKSIKHHYPTGSFYGDHFERSKPYQASRQFSHLFNSYTKHINRKTERSGTLSEGTFKRKRISGEDNFNHLVCYIHRNPIHHGISKYYSEYPHSSYNKIIGSDSTLLEKEKLFIQFGSKRNFIEAHEEFKGNLGEEFYLE